METIDITLIVLFIRSTKNKPHVYFSSEVEL